MSAALSLILLALGTGIGVSSVSPWANTGMSLNCGFGRAAIIWLIVIQIVASAMGGYLAGRLRTKWVELHTHEVYFRDTAHGFLVLGSRPRNHRGVSRVRRCIDDDWIDTGNANNVSPEFRA